MRRRTDEPFNFWPCVSDMMLAAFIFMLLLWLLDRIHQLRASVETRSSAALQIDLDKKAQENLALKQKLAGLSNPVTDIFELNRKLKDTLAENTKLQEEFRRLNNKPPIINMPEAKGFRFGSARAELPEDFARRIDEEIIPQLAALCGGNTARVDTLEVIGHTDAQAVSNNHASNLDTQLEAVAEGQAPINTLHFGSNTDLGLMRALAVAQRLRLAIRSGMLPPLDVRSYSAAQLIAPEPDDAETADPDVARRRIEIRLTRLKPSPASTP